MQNFPTGKYYKQNMERHYIMGGLVVVIEKSIIRLKYKRVLELRKRHEDAIEDIIRKRNGKTIIFLKDTPKGWHRAIT